MNALNVCGVVFLTMVAFWILEAAVVLVSYLRSRRELK